ncbi:MAG TPA: hypothetical protein VHX65_02625 [Pirellulales bacterium]|jgi:hypothetical protein|nr:hypothetical protein [Pirellulales bacterium]
MSRIRYGASLLGVALMFVCGCSDTSSSGQPVVKRPPVQHNHVEPSLQALVKNHTPPKTVVMNNGVEPSKPVGVPSDNLRPSADTSAGISAADADDPDAQVNPDMYRARKRIAGEIAEALKLRKTLVVWIIDKTNMSADVRNWAVGRISRITAEATKLASESGKAAPLAMAIVAYGSNVNFLNNEPIDPAQAESLAGALPSESEAFPQTFAAVDEAADKFLPYRSQGYEMMFVVVANSTGKDWARLDAAIPKLRRKAVPVFGIGNAVPFYRQWHAEPLGGGPPANLILASGGLESIDMALPEGQGDSDLNDSGYGPWGLERLCRQTQGAYLRFRNGSTSAGWALEGDGTISQEMRHRYAPDYVSPQEYQSLLSSNRAYQALHNAAQLPRAEQVVAYLTSRFTRPTEKQGGEAALSKKVSQAQMKAAEKSPEVDRIYEALVGGQADRAKITSPRWQAEFDLAMGRILAAKARIDGYNAQLAVIKQGKAFKDPKEHDTWVLHPSDSISAGSALDKMAKQSQMYLNRVINEHPGTPWAEMARRELEMLPGWAWTEE